MKYAFLSDVHANLPALKAVLADIDAREDVESIYHLGDLVGYAPWPNETVELLREHQVLGIAGNYDSTVATDYEHCGCKSETPFQEELAHESFEWTKDHVSEETKSSLAELPHSMDLRPTGGHTSRPRIILVHGTPTLNTLGWPEERSDSFCLKMAHAAGAREGDLVAFGHTHIPWYREVEGIHLLNAGSVGRPHDGDPRAAYVLVEVGEDKELAVEFVRVEYDVDHAVDGILESGLPDEFAYPLRAGEKPPKRDPND
jgi:predicted phosphodiesterase